MSCETLLNMVVIPTLAHLRMGGDKATNLVMGTFAQESHLGRYRRQLGGGPALGIGQMEEATYNDCWRYINSKPMLKGLILQLVPKPAFALLEVDDVLMTIMTRVKYWMAADPIPSTLEGWAFYWKQYYNTPLGKGTQEEFIENYGRYCTCLKN